MQFVEGKLPEGCYHIKADSQYELCSTILRLQEFYESSLKGIRRRFFTLEEYMDKYAESFGNFTYYSEYVGFNLRDDAIAKFYETFPPQTLLEKEKAFKKFIAPVVKKHKKYCLILTYQSTKDDLTTFAHELSHSLYYLNRKYKKEMDALTHSISKETLDTIFHELERDVSYARNVWLDEFQAYMSTSSFPYLETKGWLKHIGRRKVNEFRKVFKRYRKEL